MSVPSENMPIVHTVRGVWLQSPAFVVLQRISDMATTSVCISLLLSALSISVQ